MNEITTTENKPVSALGAMSTRLQVSEAGLMKTLKATVFKACKSDEEFMALIMVANEYKLNPITKEIYAFPGKGGGVVPMVSIDGWLKLMNRQPTFDGLSVDISPDGEEATATIHIKDRSHPVVVTEYLSECSRPTDPWKKSPKRMLRHKATIQAIRVAFGIGGIQDEDEAKDTAAGNARNVTPLREEVIDPTKLPAIEAKVEPEPIQEPEPTPEPEKKKPAINTVEVTIADYKSDSGLHIATLTTGTKTIEAKTSDDGIGSLLEFNKGEKAKVGLQQTTKGVKLTSLEIL